MRKRVPFVLAAVLVAASACSKPSREPGGDRQAPRSAPAPVADQASTGAAPKAKAPALAFERLEHDFGRVREGERVAARFAFSNPSKTESVAVKGVKVGCGCLDARLAKTVFAPGEGDEISVTYDTTGRGAKDQKYVILQIDRPLPEEIKLSVSIEILPRVVVDPMTLNFGEKPYDKIDSDELRKTLTVTTRLADIVIKDVRVRGPNVELKEVAREPFSVDGDLGERRTYSVTIVPPVPIGRLQTQIEVVTSDRLRAQTNVVLVFESLGVLRLSQDPIYLRFSSAESFSHEVFLQSRIRRTFAIKSASVTDCAAGPIEVEYEPIAAGGVTSQYRLRLKGKRPAAGGRITGKLRIETDVPGQESFSANIFGLR